MLRVYEAEITYKSSSGRKKEGVLCVAESLLDAHTQLSLYWMKHDLESIDSLRALPNPLLIREDWIL